MSKTEFTPGPWTLLSQSQTEHLGDYCTLAAAIGFEGAQFQVKQRIENTPEAYQRAQANNRLIAAAPELLEALTEAKEILAYYHKGEAPGHLDTCENPDCCGHCLMMRKVNAAIAKANGEKVSV